MTKSNIEKLYEKYPSLFGETEGKRIASYLRKLKRKRRKAYLKKRIKSKKKRIQWYKDHGLKIKRYDS